MKKLEAEVILRDMEDFLASHNEGAWPPILHDLRARASGAQDERLPPSLIQDIRELFGGMGSLSDLWISKLNGHRVENEQRANDTLNTLREALWNALHPER